MTEEDWSELRADQELNVGSSESIDISSTGSLEWRPSQTNDENAARLDR